MISWAKHPTNIHTGKALPWSLTLCIKFSTLFCRPHHLNLTVTNLYAHMYGQSFWFTSSCCIRNTPTGRQVTKRQTSGSPLAQPQPFPSPMGRGPPTLCPAPWWWGCGLHLPIGAQGSSACFDRFKFCRVFFCLVILREVVELELEKGGREGEKGKEGYGRGGKERGREGERDQIFHQSILYISLNAVGTKKI